MDGDLVTTVLTVAVLGFMATRLVGGVKVATSPSGRTLVRAVMRRAGWRHLWPVPLVLVAVIVVATALMTIPGLDWGWWAAIGGSGNPVFGSTQATSGTIWAWLIPAVFVCLLLPALPLFAHAEERIFRRGAERWSRGKRVSKTLQFGVVHAVVGIPIGAALALSVGGAYFLVVYLAAHRRSGSTNDATIESTTAHTVYNGVIIGIVLVALTATGFQP